MSTNVPGALGAIAEAAGTTAGLYIARWVEPRVKAGLTNALEDLRIKTPPVHRTLLHGWKTDTDFRASVDRNTILGITAINTVTGKITSHLGPLSEVADEITERVASAIPDILPEVLTPAAEKFQPAQGEAAPSRGQLSAAMATYLETFGERLPRMLVGQIDAFNPSRWFTKMGEQMQQAINACGPLAELSMALFWMTVLDDAERDKYAYVFFAFNTPEEVINFLGLPNDDARRLWLSMLHELNKLRLPFSLSDQREMFARIKTLHTEQLGPFLRGLSRSLRENRQRFRDEHAELFARPPQMVIPVRWAIGLAIGVPLVLLVIMLIANGCAKN